MKHYIKDDIYYIEDEKGDIVLKIFLYKDRLEGLDQIHIETEYEVYNGPVKFLSFIASMDETDFK